MPSHLGGSPWLKHLGTSNAYTARMARGITNHAPIGEYWQRFFPNEETHCRCNWGTLETRNHLFRCPLTTRVKSSTKDIHAFNKFLDKNPHVFSFPGAVTTRMPLPSRGAAQRVRQLAKFFGGPSDPANYTDITNIPPRTEAPDDMVWLPTSASYMRRDLCVQYGLMIDLTICRVYD